MSKIGKEKKRRAGGWSPRSNGTAPAPVLASDGRNSQEDQKQKGPCSETRAGTPGHTQC